MRINRKQNSVTQLSFNKKIEFFKKNVLEFKSDTKPSNIYLFFNFYRHTECGVSLTREQTHAP